MPNMEYCMFRNTRLALEDVKDRIEEGDMPESPEEIQAWKEIVEMAIDITEQSDLETEKYNLSLINDSEIDSHSRTH